MPMFDAIEKGYIRRVSRVYVFNKAGKVLIQKRSKNVLNPLLLDVSMGGHVDEGETYLEAAKRELQEELRLSVAMYPLEVVSSPSLANGFYGALYKVIIPDTQEIDFDIEEVDSVYWMKIEEVDELILNRDDECTRSLTYTWTTFRDKLIST
jgi:isopentenyl-diphosphate delta-isomerase